MQIALDAIIILPRQREELENDTYPLIDLADSIRRTHGAVHPPVINTKNELIAGGRRLAAYKLLHDTYPDEPWGMLEVVVRDEVDPVALYELELEENLYRKNLTPPEYHKAVLEFHRRRTASNIGPKRGVIGDPLLPDRWTVEKTAEAIGKSKGHVSVDLRMAEIMELMPEDKREEIYAKAGGSKEAVHREIRLMFERGEKKVAVAERIALEPKQIGTREEVRLVDALAGLKSLPDHCVDLIITDPPYGMMEGSAGEKGLGHAVYSDRGFADNDLDTLELIKACAPEMFRVLRPGSHFYMFCGVGWNEACSFHTLCPILANAGFTVRGMPLVWAKDTQGFKPPFTFWPINCEYIIFASTGRRIKEGNVPRSDCMLVQPIGGNAKDHRFQKPLPLLTQLLDVSYEPDGNFLDPFCGGGSALLAARRRWMRVLGFDSDPHAVNTAKLKLADWDREVLESNGEEQGTQMLERVKGW